MERILDVVIVERNMCKDCTKALEIMTEKVGKEDAEYWLWNETSFPFDDGKEYLKKAKEFNNYE